MFCYSFTFKLLVNNIKVVFLLWNLVKLALKKLQNWLHSNPILLHNLPENIAQFLIFYRTLSDGLYMAEHFYNQTGKTVNTRKISGMLLCCKMKASWAWETKLQARVLISFCGFVASWRTLIFAVIGCNTINIPEIF